MVLASDTTDSPDSWSAYVDFEKNLRCDFVRKRNLRRRLMSRMCRLYLSSLGMFSIDLMIESARDMHSFGLWVAHVSRPW